MKRFRRRTFPRAAAILFLAAGFAAAAQTTVIKEHWPNGRLRLSKQVLQNDDGSTMNHGKYERWYNNGNREYEAVFVLGKKEGTTVRYHRNGIKANQQEYHNGQRHGRSVSWDPSGVIVKEENWNEGKPCGVWTVWEDGKVKWRHTFACDETALSSEKLESHSPPHSKGDHHE